MAKTSIQSYDRKCDSELNWMELGSKTRLRESWKVQKPRINRKYLWKEVGFWILVSRVFRIEIRLRKAVIGDLHLSIGTVEGCNQNKTKNSLSEAYYVTNSSEIYTNAISDQTSGHGLLSLGLGAQFDNNLTINVTYDHYRSTNETFMNSFTINLRKSF